MLLFYNFSVGDRTIAMNNLRENKDFEFTSEEIEELIEMVIEKYYVLNPKGRDSGLPQMFLKITE